MIDYFLQNLRAFTRRQIAKILLRCQFKKIYFLKDETLNALYTDFMACAKKCLKPVICATAYLMHQQLVLGLVQKEELPPKCSCMFVL